MPKLRILSPVVLGILFGALGGAALHWGLPAHDSARPAGSGRNADTATAAAGGADDASYERRLASLIPGSAAAALDALEAIADPAVARAAALELTAALGGEADAIERVAAHVRPGAQLGYRADAYARWAERSATAALEAALATSDDPATQWTLVQRIAVALAQSSAAAAWLAAADVPGPELRNAFRTALLAEWAVVDSAAALDFLERVDTAELPADLELHDLLVTADPDRLLAVTARFPAIARLSARRDALGILAARDPELALRRWRSLSPESERRTLLASLARGYAVNDPRAAFAWAQGEPDSQSLLPAVLSGIATVDFDGALELIADSAAAGRDEAFDWAADVMQNGVSPADARRLLDALATNARPESADRINSALYRWARDDAAAAVDWLVANGDKVPVDIAGSVANIVARADTDLAMSAASLLPADRRGDWVRNVVGTVAAVDLSRALGLLEPYRAEPFYNGALRDIAFARSSYDPAAAARLLTEAGENAGSAGLARRWAARDPAATAAWVSQLPPGEARRDAFGPVAEQWARRDLERGLAWALGLPRADRDAALAGLAAGVAQNGAVDERVFASFGSEEAMFAAAESAVTALGARYPERARRFIDTLAADAQRREQLERALARTLMHRFTP
jgi:hypothetical protein